MKRARAAITLSRGEVHKSELIESVADEGEHLGTPDVYGRLYVVAGNITLIVSGTKASFPSPSLPFPPPSTLRLHCSHVVLFDKAGRNEGCEEGVP